MRLLAFLVAAAFLAGCIEAPAPGTTIEPDAYEAPPTSGPAPRAALDEEAMFCASESECDFWDDDYHELVLYEPDSTVLDVLIVPSASQDSAVDTPIIKAAVQAWADGFRAFGAPWFADGMVLNVYVLGTDSPPQSALDDPEIVIVAAEYNPVVLFGIGLEPKQFVCGAFGQETERMYPVHAHHGMQVQAADCTGMGFVCVAFNSNFLLGTPIELQDLVAHEFGHCLGGGHVGDALDFKAKRVPVQDIMSYQHNETQVHCVSNLNVRVLENVYGALLGHAPETPLAPLEFYTMPRAEYEHVLCENAA